MSKEDPFPWDDPTLIYIGAVVLAGMIIIFAKDIFEWLGL